MAGVEQDGGIARSAVDAEEKKEAVVSLELERERRLVDRAQAGEMGARRELLGRYMDALFSRIILPRVGDEPAAEDILKATMVSAIEKLHTFQWQGTSIYAWLRQIAVNKVVDHHRRNQRGRRLADALRREGDLAPVAPSRGPRPDEAVIAEQERALNRQRIEGAMAKINPRYRRAIELRLIEDRPREDCARELQVTMGTFDVLFYRAVRAFRREFGER